MSPRIAEPELPVVKEAPSSAPFGLLGSLTTFSTFGYQTIELAREGSPKLAIVNVVANLAIGLPAVMLGLWIGKKFVGE